jgi:hypothetical protein
VLLFHVASAPVLCRPLMSGSSCSGFCSREFASKQQFVQATAVALLDSSQSS